METQDAFSVQVGSTSCPVWRSARNPVIFTAAAVASVSTAGSGRFYGGTYFQFSSSPLSQGTSLYQTGHHAEPDRNPQSQGPRGSHPVLYLL